MTGSPAKILAAGTLGCLLLTAGGYLGVISPMLSERAADLEGAALAADQAAAKHAQADQLQAKAEQLDGEINRANRLVQQFPNTYQQGDWFDQISSAAADHGFTIETVVPGVPTAPLTDTDSGTTADDTTAETDADDTASIPDGAEAFAATDVGTFPIAESAVTLNVTGPARNVTAFLTAVEDLDRPLLVEQLSVRGEGQVRIEMSGRTFLTRPLQVPEHLADELDR